MSIITLNMNELIQSDWVTKTWFNYMPFTGDTQSTQSYK